MRRVLIGTPSYDGKVDVHFANSLLDTIKMSFEKGIHVHVIYTAYDSLVQRARNCLFQMAMVGGYDDLFFIDSDVEWDAEWFFRLLERPEPIVGAGLIKKSDNETYTIKLLDKNLKWSEDGKMIEVDGIGTGFMRITRFALEKLWEISTIYNSEGTEHRMICDIQVENGQLISEDFIICKKWQDLGFKTWIDPNITITHIGTKIYRGNFREFIKKIGYI